jgi:CubicO group peptidase (beta-lactamase class C family)
MTPNLPLPQVKPESVGMSSARLARLIPAMQSYIDRQQLPNVVTMVAREGKIVHFQAQGYQDVNKKTPAVNDTIFRLYSDTKPITGAAVMLLVEDGLLNLNDPVSKYIPAFKNPMVISPVRGRPADITNLIPAAREITVRDCVANTTGLATLRRSPHWFSSKYKNHIEESGWDIVESIDTPPRKTFRERVEAHARLPLTTDPGASYEYHIGYPVIGVIIEIVTGKTLEEFYQERIFRPLGMKDTSFYLEKNKLKRFSTSYKPKYENGQWSLDVFDQAETSEKVKGPKIHFGAGGDLGGALSTVPDYARFVQMLLNNGEFDGARILSRKSVELMTSDQTGGILTDEGPGFGFGLGVEVYKGGGIYPIMFSPGEFGKGGACGTVFFADPKEKLFGICFTQKMISPALTRNIDAPTSPDHTYLDVFKRMVYQSLL